MAGLGGPPLPGPALARFAGLFAEAANDPLRGEYGDLLSPYLIDLNANNVSAETVRAQLTAAGNRRHPLCLGVVVEGKVHLFFLPFKWELAAGVAADAALDNKLFAFDGELVNGQGCIVELPIDLFHQLNVQVHVGTVDHIKNELAGDTSLDFMMGPFTNADAGTEVVKTRMMCIIPFQYVPALLTQVDGVSPRYYFETVLPQIETDGKAAACLPLTRLFQVAITRHTVGGPSILEVQRPMAPPRRLALLQHAQSLIYHFFPQANPALMGAQNSAVATQLVNLHIQKQAHHDEAKREKLEEKRKSVEKWLGPDNLKRLLRFCRVGTEADLPAFWHRMAAAKEKDRLALLQSAVREELVTMGEAYLGESYCPTPRLLANLIAMMWAMVNPDALETGALGNAFLFGDLDVEQQQEIIAILDLVRSGGASPSLADSQELLKLKINLPTENGSLRCVRRMEALFRAVLPVGHPALAFVSAHYKSMKGAEHMWQSHVPSNPMTKPAKGALHLLWLSTRLTKYFRKQATTDDQVALEDPEGIMDKIDLGDRWEPNLSPTFVARYSIHSLLSLGNKALGYLQDDGTATTDDMSTLSGTTGRSAEGSGGGSTVGGSGGGGGAQSLGIGPPKNVRVENTHFNEALFGQYRVHKTKARALRDKIAKKEIRALPASKVDASMPMCLAWHTKGQCNTGCPCAKDHVPYTADEYKDLLAWCQECYDS